MSLTSLIRQDPEIRTAFRKCAMAVQTPDHVRGAPLRVPDAGGPRGLAGTAFDHLVSLKIIRDLRQSNIVVREDKGLLDEVETRLDIISLEPRFHDYLTQSIKAARHESLEYAVGRGDVRRLAFLMQDVASAVMAFRGGTTPDPDFKPKDAITDELLAMLDLFDLQRHLAPREMCLLKPTFCAGEFIGGADADLVVDHTLFDIKTNKKAHIEADMLCQLAGYAALQRIGGIKLEEITHNAPFRSVGLYFGRHGVGCLWTVDQLFRGDGFEQFTSIFQRIASKNQQLAAERQRQFSTIKQMIRSQSKAPKRARRKAKSSVSKRSQ